MDKRFEKLLDREQQGQFKIYWKPGKTNLVDYFTKHHPPAHHRNVQGEFLTRVAELQQLRATKDNSVDIMIEHLSLVTDQVVTHSDQASTRTDQDSTYVCNMETSLVMTDGIMFPNWSARVC